MTGICLSFLLVATGTVSNCLGDAQERVKPVPPSAQDIVATASKKAGHEHKSVFVVFGSTTCPPCRTLDKLFEAPGIKPFFERSYVVAHVNCREATDKSLENAGAEALMTKLDIGGDGVPCFAVLTPQGQMLTNSNYSKTEKWSANMGFPDANRVEDLIGLLALTARPTVEEQDSIRTFVKNHSG